ncbi:MAG: hypothetical protein HC862_03320 [Scytonema sp. RU_4_4]|nr:hypothetical protein [Scytonema sp. RU_4_4]NJR72929.1 hypothetical protein [Scytonema sp. CRU_2_7]
MPLNVNAFPTCRRAAVKQRSWEGFQRQLPAAGDSSAVLAPAADDCVLPTEELGIAL